MNAESGDSAEIRRRRRAWILANHPDRGGDPDVFATGLARFADDRTADAPQDRRMTVYRSRSPWRTLRRAARTIGRARAGHTRSRRVL